MRLGCTLYSRVYDVRPGWTLYMVVVQCTSQMDTLRGCAVYVLDGHSTSESIVYASGTHIVQHSV